MADQKITELPIKTSTGINLTDYLLGIDSAEGYQMLVSDIAKKIVEDYAGSTLAGGAQSIASAFTQVPLLAGVNTILTSNTDLNTVTTVGTYNASNAVAGSLVNGPEGVTLRAFRMTVERALGTGSEWYRQTIILGASVYSGYRRYTAGGVTWSTWEKIPERSEIDTLTTNIGTFSSVAIPIAASASAEDLVYTSDTLSNGVYLLILSRLNNAASEYDYIGFLTVHNTSHVSDIFRGSSAPDDIAVTNKVLTFTRKNNNVSGRLIRL